MRINTNMNAMLSTNQAAKSTALSGKSMEKLASGLRITKAGDDAAGLAISEKMRAQIRGMEQASRNTQDGISMVQTAEGAMEEVGNITQRMRELAVQASTETNNPQDREKIQAEIDQLTDQIDNIAQSTKFNGEQLLNGGPGVTGNLASTTGVTVNVTGNLIDEGTTVTLTQGTGASINEFTLEAVSGGTTITQTVTLGDSARVLVEGEDTADDTSDDVYAITDKLNFTNAGISIDLDSVADVTSVTGEFSATAGDNKSVSIQTGANNTTSETITVSVAKTDSSSLGINALDVTTTTRAKSAITALDTAIEKINTNRANLGAMQNRLEYTDSNLQSTTENLSAAESRIRDVDMAKEMVELSKLNILTQASQAMISQAKSQPESVLQLLR